MSSRLFGSNILVLWVLLFVHSVFCSCRFNAEGLFRKASDASISSKDQSPFAEDVPRTDSGSTMEGDGIQPDPECVHNPSGNVCRFQQGQPFGESGTCVLGRFVRFRYCFENAPCGKDGHCLPALPCQACPGCEPGTICSAFVVENPGIASVAICCAKNVHNGKGQEGDNCLKHEDCSSGLCSAINRCFSPCVPEEKECSGAQICGDVEVDVEGFKFSLKGCVLRADGGPSDGGLDSGGGMFKDSSMSSQDAKQDGAKR